MNNTEIGGLIALAQVLAPQQKFSDGTPVGDQIVTAVWTQFLGDLPADLAKAALMEHFADGGGPWVSPPDVRRRVLNGAGLLMPPLDVAWAAVEKWLRRIDLPDESDYLVTFKQLSEDSERGFDRRRAKRLALLPGWLAAVLGPLYAELTGKGDMVWKRKAFEAAYIGAAKRNNLMMLRPGAVTPELLALGQNAYSLNQARAAAFAQIEGAPTGAAATAFRLKLGPVDAGALGVEDGADVGTVDAEIIETYKQYQQRERDEAFDDWREAR